ncbi:MAG: proton-conducting transporter membrane subunit [Chloroflexota bacterium]|nr:proton-conducting transporter membrane subunit [Chloroflexota bacterium]MDE2911156.1 proton-conducting transporter membrane subunit [Chloroflexota bacterium]
MELALIAAAPFGLSLLLATPFARITLGKLAQTILSSLVMAALFVWLISMAPRAQVEGAISQTIMWMPSAGISLSFYLDGLALLFGLLISGIGALIFFYAGFYFDDPKEHNRFIIWLLAFAGAMLAVVLAGNVLMMFIAWELTSITSFILIGFKGADDAAAREGAFKALFVTGLGALALLVGLVMLSAAAGDILHPEEEIRFVGDFASILQATTLHQHEWYLLFTILILLGGFTKSAQFPFHFWLPGAMSAPSPASAYLHSATMVKAGIYLFARLSPVMHANELWTNALLIAGLATMLVGAYFAVFQRDLKGLLAYSTVSKLGAIVAMIGLPNQSGLKAAFLGIIAHALYKSALFLVAGTIDHATGTRHIDRLGGLRRQMPILFWVTVVSALSMAGFPFLLGFVAKETLLDAMLHYTTSGTLLVMLIVTVSAAFTAMAGYMLIYDVFLGRPRTRLHFHQPSSWIRLGPALLALGSLSLGFLLEPFIVPILELAVPKSFELHLFAGFNDVFFLSAAILVAGFFLFRLRKSLIARITFPLSADAVYREFISYLEWAGTTVLQTQSGFVRYYLAIILGVVAIVLTVEGSRSEVFAGLQILPTDLSVTITDLAKIFMLVLVVAAGLLTVVVREHVKAAIAYGVIGYAIGVIFLINRAPDVALVQMLVETMATVLIIIMLGRIRADARLKVINNLWKGRHDHRGGLLRDLGISIVIGLSVFVFSLTALQNRAERQSIAEWHLANAKSVNTDDVVGAIVADFRGSDTLLEVAVFTTAALGVLTLLGRGRQQGGALTPSAARVSSLRETDASDGEDIQDATSLSTPFTRSVSFIVLPIAILIGLAQILFGGKGPGDGFTAGVTIGLAVSLWYVVLGYNEAKQLLPWFKPALIVRLGLIIAIANGLFPILINQGFMGHVEYDQALGIYDIVGSFGLHITSSLIFEIAIAIAVMGGIGIIIEAIAYPSERSREPAEALIGDSG